MGSRRGLRRGQNKAAVAVARKLTVPIWHVLQGHQNKALEETTTLLTKLTKLATNLGLPTLKKLGYASKMAFQEEKLAVLRTHPQDGEPRFPKPLLWENIWLRPRDTPREPTQKP